MMTTATHSAAMPSFACRRMFFDWPVPVRRSRKGDNTREVKILNNAKRITTKSGEKSHNGVVAHDNSMIWRTVWTDALDMIKVIRIRKFLRALQKDGSRIRVPSALMPTMLIMMNMYMNIKVALDVFANMCGHKNVVLSGFRRCSGLCRYNTTAISPKRLQSHCV